MAWTLYKEIRYAAAGIPDAMLADYPKRFRIVADADIAGELAGGGGVKVTSADGLTDLPFGVYADSDFSLGTVHFRAKFTLSAVANVGDVIGRLYYSASSGPIIEDREGVVSADYELFLPLEEGSVSAPELLDWTGNDADGTLEPDAATGPQFEFDATLDLPALDFDGSDDYVAATLGASLVTGAATFSYWINPDVLALQYPMSLGLSGAIRLSTFLDADGTIGLFDGATVSASANLGLVTGSWQHVAVSYDGIGAMAAYFNGVALASGSQSISGALASQNELNIGQRVGGAFKVNGRIASPTISSVARSAEWIAYDYTDGIDNADTFTLGEEEDDTPIDPSTLYGWLEFTAPKQAMHFAATKDRVHFEAPKQAMHYTATGEDT